MQQQGDASVQGSPVPEAGWQSALGHSPETACPLLGLRQDPGSHFSMPVDDHRCAAGTKPATIDTARQRELCLSAAFATCERLTARPDAAAIVASVFPTGSPGPGAASTGSLAAASGPAPVPGVPPAPGGSAGPGSGYIPGSDGPRRPRRRLVLVVGAIITVILVVAIIVFVAGILLAPAATATP
jgi:hypothetical protein